MLVGNKVDLVEESPERRLVTGAEAQQFASAEGLLWIETSAVTGNKVKDAFETLLETISRKNRGRQREDPGGNLQARPGQKDKSCCSL